jgi:hypothetical protein
LLVSLQFVPQYFFSFTLKAADMRSIKFVFLNAFIMDLTSYFMDGPIMATLLRSSAELAVESAKMGIEKNVSAATSMNFLGSF